jgi:hypothetical protein
VASTAKLPPHNEEGGDQENTKDDPVYHEHFEGALFQVLQQEFDHKETA